MIPIFLVMKHLTGLCRFFRGVDKTDKTGIYAERHPRPHKEVNEVFCELVILVKESINRGGQVQLHKQFFGETSTIMKVVSGIFVNLFQEILFLKFVIFFSYSLQFFYLSLWLMPELMLCPLMLFRVPTMILVSVKRIPGMVFLIR